MTKTIKERLAALEVKTRVVIVLLGAHLGIDLIPTVSANFIPFIIENATKALNTILPTL